MAITIQKLNGEAIHTVMLVAHNKDSILFGNGIGGDMKFGGDTHFRGSKVNYI